MNKIIYWNEQVNKTHIIQVFLKLMEFYELNLLNFYIPNTISKKPNDYSSRSCLAEIFSYKVLLHDSILTDFNFKYPVSLLIRCIFNDVSYR